jgi:hypothetical protein
MSRLIPDIADCDHQPILKLVKDSEGREAVIRFIKANMEQIVYHYIDCTWGACYSMKFKELIKPYLDDVALLDKILRSSKIKDKPNVIIGKSGAKVFDRLLEQLLKCDSSEIENYLRKEFNLKTS